MAVACAMGHPLKVGSTMTCSWRGGRLGWAVNPLYIAVEWMGLILCTLL